MISRNKSGRSSGITLVILCLGVALLGLMWSVAPTPSEVAAAATKPAPVPQPAPEPAGVNPPEPAKTADPGIRTGVDRKASFPTKENLTLKLSADLGTVKITSLPVGSPAVVRYTAHIETDAHQPLADRLLTHYSLNAEATATGVNITGTLPSQIAKSSAAGVQFWVTFEIAVPHGYNVEVRTDAGDIETQDLGGTAILATQGGNITAGRIGTSFMRNAGAGRMVARLQTEGGHIQVLDVGGDLNAFTAGGHINVRNIAGDATLHSGGGHIRAEQIAGRADLETDGGNITVGQAGNYVAVKTGGGQIDFGEVRGSVRAQTGGGGIRVMYVAGPMEVESSAGSICLTRVAGTVRAATAGGSIRAWINPDSPATGGGVVHLAGVSQLTSGNGDIVVFLPRNLAADIDATVEAGGERHIEADPALAMMIQGNHTAGSAHGMIALNGGGAPLKLRTTSGVIRLRFLDTEVALRDSLIRDQKERLNQHGVQLVPANYDPSEPMGQAQPGNAPQPGDGDWLESWIDRLQLAFIGGTHEDPEEFRKHLTWQPQPIYPEVAMRAGVTGLVKLQVRATRDGHIEVEKLLDGSPALADAAITAVKQWHVSPAWMVGKRGDVITTLTFNFQLH